MDCIHSTAQPRTSFRIRSYRNAAEAIEANPQQIADLISDPKQVLAISGIGNQARAEMDPSRSLSFRAYGADGKPVTPFL